MSKPDARRLGLIGLVGSISLYALLQGAVLVVSHFHAALNDFWLLRAFADRFHWTNPGALQDGFFPYLYPLLQKFVPAGVALPASALLSLASACAILVFGYLIARCVIGPVWALVAVWIVGMQPEFFLNATIAGADMLAALPAVIGMWVLLRLAGGSARSRQTLRLLLVSGILFGVAATLRYHVLLLGVIPIALGLQLAAARWRAAGIALLGVVIGYAPQMVVNVAAGQSPLATLQGFNVYRTVVGVDWNTTDRLDPAQYLSVLTILRSHPIEFATTYLAALSNFVFPLAVIGVAAFCTIGTRWLPYLRALLAGSIAFALATSLAYSGRAFIAFMPIWGVAAAIVVGTAAIWIIRVAGREHQFDALHVRATLALALALVLAWGTYSWVQTDVANAIGRSQLEHERADHEAAFLAHAQVASMDEVFTNDFNFYTTKVPGTVPIHNGGLVQISQRGTPLAHRLDGSSVDAFLCSAAQQGVKAVIWNPGSTSGFAPELAAILAGQATHPNVTTAPSTGLVVSTLHFTADPCR